jgi:hypothetical protein
MAVALQDFYGDRRAVLPVKLRLSWKRHGCPREGHSRLSKEGPDRQRRLRQSGELDRVHV